MAIKDLSSTTVANILILISQVNDYKSAAITEAKKSKAWDPRHSKLAGADNPNGIKDWFNTYIKPTAPAPGTST